MRTPKPTPLTVLERPTVSLSIVILWRNCQQDNFDFQPFGSEETFEDSTLVGVAAQVAHRLIDVAKHSCFGNWAGIKRAVRERNIAFKLTRFNPDMKGHATSRMPLNTNCVLDDQNELAAATHVFTLLVNDFLLVTLDKLENPESLILRPPRPDF